MSNKLYQLVKFIFQPKLKVMALVAAISATLFAFGCYVAIFITPNDYLQGIYMKIMYIHVPSAWLSMALYMLMAIFSAAYIAWKTPIYSIIAEAICPVGICLTFITLATGAIWGAPTWGTWWVWDARLTSMLILLFIYIGCMALRNSFYGREKGGIFTAYFVLFGIVNIPIIKFSVNIWSTLHQPASFLRLSGPAVHSSMMPPLFIMLAALISITWVVVSLLTQAEQLKRKYQRCIVR